MLYNTIKYDTLQYNAMLCNIVQFAPPAASTEPSLTWSGQLPPRAYKNPTYSAKVFLGGVPWDITEGKLLGRWY